MEGFIPQSKELIENLKKYDGKGDWEISINLRNVYLRLEFNLEIEGIFDLFWWPMYCIHYLFKFSGQTHAKNGNKMEQRSFEPDRQ